MPLKTAVAVLLEHEGIIRAALHQYAHDARRTAAQAAGVEPKAGGLLTSEQMPSVVEIFAEQAERADEAVTALAALSDGYDRYFQQQLEQALADSAAGNTTDLGSFAGDDDGYPGCAGDAVEATAS